MKHLLLVLIILAITSPSYAIEGQVYFSILGDSNKQAYPLDPTGGAKFVSGIELGHEIGIWKSLSIRPWTSLDVLMDDRDGEDFHPSSIDFQVGITSNIWKGLYIEIKHSCWHPIDRAGKVEVYDQLTIAWRF